MDATTKRVQHFAIPGIIQFIKTSILFLFCLPGLLFAQPAEIIVEDIQSGGSSNVLSVSTNSDVTAVNDDFYLAIISTKSRVNTTDVTGLGLTWTLVKAQCSGRSHTGVDIWRADGVPTGDSPVSAILDDDPRNAVITVVRFSGVDTDDPIGAILGANDNGFDGACSGGTDARDYTFDFATTTDGAMIFGGVGTRNRDHTPGAGYTEIDEFSQGSSSSRANLALQTQILATAGTVPFASTFSGKVDWAAAAIELKPGNAGPIFRTLAVDASPAIGGSVAVDPDKAQYDNGEDVTLTATPAAGYEFVNWTGDIGGANATSSEITLTMSQNRTVTANFQPIQRTLTTSVDPNNGGAISRSPNQSTYDDGSSVDLTANPATGFLFVNWSGDIGGATATDPTISVTMDQDRSIQANFTPIQRSLTVTVDPVNGGSVSQTPDQATYDHGTVVGLVATPETGFEFTRWSGDIGGANASAASISVTMDQDRNITATFSPIPESVVSTVSSSGDAPFTGDQITATINVDMTGSLSLLGAFTGALSWDETVLSYVSHSGLQNGFTGIVNDGSAGSGQLGFDGSNGAGAGGVFDILTVTFDVIGSAGSNGALDLAYSVITATDSDDLLPDLTTNDDAITVDGYQITGSFVPSNGGSGTLSPQKPLYDNGESVTLSATPAVGFEFSHWSGDIGGATASDLSISVTMDQDRNINANFSPIQRTLTTNVSPAATGSVSASPDKVTYDHGETVNLTANAVSGYQFSHWTGDIGGADANSSSISLVMDQDRSVTANFIEGAAEVVYEGATTGQVSGEFFVETDGNVPAVDGQLYLVAISSKPRKTVTNVSGMGLAWTRVDEQCSGREHNMVEIWMALATSASSGIVRADFDDDPTHAVIAVTRYSGVDAVTPIGNVVSKNPNGIDGNCSGGSDQRDYSFQLTTTADGAVVYSVASTRNKTHTPGSGYDEKLELSQGSSSNIVNIAIQDQKFDTAGDVTVNGFFSGRVDWSAVGLEILPDGSSGPIVRTLNTNISPAGGGAVAVDPDKATYDNNEMVTLTATAAANFEFVNWSGDIGGATATDTEITVTMSQNRTITANFAPVQRSLTTSVSPASSGSIGAGPDKATYDHSESVDLTATPAAGFEFVNWTGDIGGATATDAQITLTMDQDRTVQANFAPIQRTLTLTENPVNGGTASADPDKVTYDHGESVDLTATPANGFEFVNWTGDIDDATATDAQISVAMDQDRSIQANFNQLPEAVISSVQPADTSVFTGQPVSITIDANMINSFDLLGSFSGSLQWDSAVLSYVSNSGLLSGFTGTVTTDNAATGSLTFSGSHATDLDGAFDLLTINFNVIGNAGDVSALDLAYSAMASNVPEDLLPILAINDGNVTVGGYTLNANANPGAGGSVAKSLDQSSYDPGAVVDLTATVADGYIFSSWSGDIGGATATDLTISVTMDQDRNVTANFAPVQRVLDYSASPGVAGTVTVDPEKNTYDHGESVVLTATAVNGFQFAGWGGEIGDADPTQNPLTLVMNRNRDVIANFIPGNAEVTFESVHTGTAAGVTSVMTSDTLPGVENHLYLAAISAKSNKPVLGVTGMGLTWTALEAQCSRNNQTSSEIWMALGTPSHDGKVTAIFSAAPENAVIIVARYSGVNTDNPIGNTISANYNGVDGNCSGGTNSTSFSVDMNTTEDNSMVFGAVARRLNPHTPGTGFTERKEVQAGAGGSAAGLAITEMMVETAGQMTFSGTFNSNTEWAFSGVEVIAGGASGPAQYVLTTNAAPEEGGSVSRNPNQVIYEEGSVVELTAAPSPGYLFDNWSGDIGGATATDNPISITMDMHSTVTANFSRIPGVLSVATPSNDSPFSGETITVAISADMTAISDLLGAFTGTLNWDASVLSYTSDSDLLQGFTGTVDRSNTGTGQIGFDGNHGSGVGGTVDLITLTFEVIGSAGDASVLDLAYSAMTSPTAVDLTGTLFLMDGDVTVDGNELSVQITPPGSGAGIISISPEKAAYDADEMVTLTVTVNDNFEFDSWSGDIGGATSTDNTIVVLMDQDRSITANFNPINLGNFQPFGTVYVDPAFEIDGQGRDVDTIDFWEAPDSSNTLMFVTAKNNSLVEVWKYPFTENEQPSLIHPTFTNSRVNGVVVDQETDLLYISVSSPSSTVSVFSLPDLTFIYNFNKEGVDLKSEPNIGLLKLPNGDKRMYVSADRIFFIHDATTGEYLSEFVPGTSVETVAPDEFYQRLYVPDESDRSGVNVFNPDGTLYFQGDSSNFGGNNIFQGDEEGAIVYKCPHHGLYDNGCGLIVVSDQIGAQTEFEFFDRKNWNYLGQMIMPGVANTDGIQNHQRPLPDYPMGLFVAIDDDATTVGVGWDVIFDSTGLVCPGSTPPAAKLAGGALNNGGPKLTTNNTPAIPKTLELQRNYPNPFNPSTTIRYGLPAEMAVTIEIYNILGQRIRVLVDQTESAGYKQVVWNGVDDFGQAVGSGIYFVQLKTSEKRLIQKILLQK